MFEKDMKERLQRIFDLPVSYSEPGESNEQEKIFVQINRARPKIKDGKELCMVEAEVSVFGSLDKMPYGYFSKAIDRSDPDDRSRFFFFEFEQNTQIFQNIVQRSFSLVFFYSGQYDPEQGSITSTTINEVTE